MERKEILMGLAVKLFIFAVCVFMIASTPTDPSTTTIGGVMAFILFLAVLFKGERVLRKIREKEGMEKVEWFIILNTFIAVMMMLALILIPKSSIYLLILSLVAGFTAGLITSEWLFLRKFWHKEGNLLVSWILIAILMFPLFAPAFKNSLLPEILAYTDATPTGAVSKETITIKKALDAKGTEIKVSITKYLLERKYTKVRASCYVDGLYFFAETPLIDSSMTPVEGSVIPPIFLSELNKTSSGLVVERAVNKSVTENGLVLGNFSSTGKQDKFYESSLTYNPVRYIWDGNVTFISIESQPLYVKYDHPDNGPYEPTYNIPPNELYSTTMRGHTRYISHIPKHTIQDVKTQGTLVFGMTEILTPILWFLLGAPEAFGTKIAATILALVEGIITAMHLLFNWFIDTVITSELDDGWMYSWNYGSFWIFHWMWISFGAWRDIGFFVMWINPEEPASPAIGYVDNYLIIDGPALLIGGLGKDTYGAHAHTNASIWPTCYVADINGNPLEGIEVRFTLTSPDGKTVTFDPVYTDSNGLAQIGFALNPDYASPGVYYITALVDGTFKDTTAFSYKSCLLFLGYTYDLKNVYIESVYLLEEGAVYKVTAYPPPEYKLKRWIINFRFEIYGNPIYIQLDIDAFVIAHYVLISSGGEHPGRFLLK